MRDWFDLTYLRQGTPRQQAAWRAIDTLGTMAALADYTPVLVGTIPLDIDLPASDLDILCHVTDPPRFAAALVAAYAHVPGFRLRTRIRVAEQATVCSFAWANFEFEIYGAAPPVTAQNGYRHMVVEARLLDLAGPGTRAAIRQLKAAGLKTEPAFAAYFGLHGDPYAALLELDALSAAELAARCAHTQHGVPPHDRQDR